MVGAGLGSEMKVRLRVGDWIDISSGVGKWGSVWVMQWGLDWGGNISDWTGV